MNSIIGKLCPFHQAFHPQALAAMLELLARRYRNGFAFPADSGPQARLTWGTKFELLNLEASCLSPGFKNHAKISDALNHS